MPQPTTTASATIAAAASPTPGAGPPILGAWLVVRRRSLLSFPRRRYVVLTDDHVLMIDSTPVLHMVDCLVSTNTSAKVIDLTPAPNSGLPVRIFADSPFQYSKWRLALQNSAATSLRRFYRLDADSFIGVGVHGIVRRAYPEIPFREDSIESGTTASEFSAHPNHRSSASRRLFRRRTPVRNSVDLDPDAQIEQSAQLSESAVPATKNDKRFLRQKSLRNPDGEAAPPRPVSVAVKTVSRTGGGAVTVASEVLFAKARLNHFAIVRVLDMFETVNEVHIVTEECMGGSLTQYVQTNGPLPEPDARSMFSPLLKAVGFMHAAGIVHWDLCPNNVLFLNSSLPLEPKIIDFGTARPIDPDNGRVPPEYSVFSEKGKVASLACASPELLTSKAHRYAAKADMWQLGCILYFLLVGKLPFPKRNPQDLSVSTTILSFCKRRHAERHDFLFGPEATDVVFSGGAKDLVLKLLCPNPRMRPNALQCLREFAFITDL